MDSHKTSPLRDFIAFVRLIGDDVSVAQGGGGNFSYKPAPEKMFVKPSGARFQEISEDSLVEIDLTKFREAFVCETRRKVSVRQHEEAMNLLLAQCVRRGAKASMETAMHCFLPSFVLHTHNILANVFLCMKGGSALLEKIFYDIGAVFIPYVSPGYSLGVKIFQHAVDNAGENVFFLENHGIVICAESLEELKRRFFSVSERCADYLSRKIGGFRLFNRDFLKEWINDRSSRCVHSNTAAGQRYFLQTEERAPLQPRRYVGASRGRSPHAARSLPEKLFLGNIAGQPQICEKLQGFLFPDAAIYVHKPNTQSALENLAAEDYIKNMIQRLGGKPRFLSPDSVNYLLRMASEKYRQNRI